MTEIKIEDVIVGGVRSPVRVGGKREAEEAVVLLHGNPGSSEDWLDLLPRIAEFARVIAPDMPGYGKADRPEAFDYTVPGYARHLTGILEQLGVKRAHLVLHDFGGPWGMQWAADHGAQVASLTLLNVGVVPGFKWHKFARVWRTPIFGELLQLTATRPLFHLLVNADNPKPFPKPFLDRMFDDSDASSKRAVLKLYRATSDLSGMTIGFGERLKPLRLPALVIWGDGDKYLPVRFAHTQAQYFDAQVHILPNVGHWPMIDEPERVRDLVLPFLRERVREPRARAAPFSRRASVRSLPSTSITSNKPGVALRPVSATRAGWAMSLSAMPLASDQALTRASSAPRSNAGACFTSLSSVSSTGAAAGTSSFATAFSSITGSSRKK
jgi:pimeloyl-ACP methyl ester carboxylesterase